MKARVAKVLGFCVCVNLWMGHACAAPLSIVSQFNPSAEGGVVGLTHSSSTDLVWAYGGFNSSITAYQTDGTLDHAVTRPGGSANDADLDINLEAFSLNSVNVPAGSLLYTDGESGVAEIYAMNPDTGAVIASLATAFGTSHVVGSAYHPGRESFFLVQDRVPGGDAANRVAEIDPSDGSVIQTFKVTDADASFTVNYGDLDVRTSNGNLLIVSSDESRILELTPVGGFVTTHDLPAGVSGLSGIGYNDSNGRIWVTSSGGQVTQLSAIPIPADIDGDGDVDGVDLGIAFGAFTGPIAPVSVPEPGSLLMCLIATAIAAKRRMP